MELCSLFMVLAIMTGIDSQRHNVGFLIVFNGNGKESRINMFVSSKQSIATKEITHQYKLITVLQ